MLWPFHRKTSEEEFSAAEQAEAPEAALDLVEWGVRLGMLGKPELAVQRLARAIKHDKNDPAAHYNLGLALDKMGKHAQAVESYSRALEIAPKSVDARVSLGAALVASGDPKGAIKELTRAVEIAPDDASAWFTLGCAYLSNRSHKNAVETFRKALELDPSDAETRFNLAVALRKADCPDLAEIEMRGFLEMAGDRYPEHRAWVESALRFQNDVETNDADDAT